MAETISLAITFFVGLIALLNPITTIPYYFGLHNNPDKKTILKDAEIISLAVLGILIFFLIFGKYVLQFIGLDISFFKIAGGVLIIYSAFSMTQGKMPTLKTKKAEDEEIKHTYMEKGLIMPLAMPLTSGPGSIAYVISHSLASDFMAMFIAIFLGAITTFIVLRNGYFLQKLLGDIGMKLISRFMGLLLLGVGIQIIFTNILPIIKQGLF